MNDNSIKIFIKKMKSSYSKKCVISLPAYLYNKVSDIFTGKLKVGLSVYDVTFLPNFTQNIIELPFIVMQEIGIVDGLNCNAKLDNNLLSLGPVIAVFTSNGAIKKAIEQKPKFRTKELMDSNEYANSILYFFSFKDVNFLESKINGTFFNNITKLWEKKNLPLPDVLYDRGGGTLKKQRIISDVIREQFNKNENIKNINSTYTFNKWDVHQNLINKDEINSYLPFTTKYNCSNDLKDCFNKNNYLYIKDCNGSNGRGVVKVAKSSENEYKFSYFDKKINIIKFNSFSKLINKIESFFEDKEFIIQSAIDIIRYDNKPVDLRATVQRNRKGEISIPAYPVRVGKLNSPITSTKSGSTVYRFSYFFRNLMNFSDDEFNELKNNINTFLVKIYKNIEDVYGPYGEIGIDFAIDSNKKLWFIECNAKPGKDTVYLSYGRKIVTQSFLNPLDYALYISEF